jgi:hypothetical protein
VVPKWKHAVQEWLLTHLDGYFLTNALPLSLFFLDKDLLYGDKTLFH